MLLSSCGIGQAQGQVKNSNEVPYKRIPVDAGGGYFGGLAWPPGGWIFAGYSTGVPGAVPEVRKLRPDGSDLQAVPLPDDPACTRTYYSGFGVLHDGRVALAKVCQAPSGVSPSASYAVVGYDVMSGKIEQLLPLQNKVPPGPVSFDLNDQRAVTAQGGSICVSLTYLTRQGAEPIPASVQDGNRQWRLDAYFDQKASVDCSQTARADGADWSRDGKQIAFFGFPKAIGLHGTARLDVPGNLYLLDPVTLKVQELVHDVQYPSVASWSPDGRYLAFSASNVPGLGRGTWLLSTVSHQFSRVSNRDMVQVVWSPDGAQLVGVWDNGKSVYPPQTELDLFDVRSVTSEGSAR